VMKMLYHSLDLRFPETDPRTTDARIIGEKIDHLNKIVEQVLALSRNAEPQLAPVDVNLALQELNLLLRHKLKNQGVETVSELQPDLPLVAGDETQLEQVFLNLSLNAVEAMPEGGQLNVITRTVPSPEGDGRPWVEVEFSDTGRGMTKEEQQGVFKSLLKTSKQKGTGIGLAIVGRIIEAHRGKIELHSARGKGTSIRILLPTI